MGDIYIYGGVVINEGQKFRANLRICGEKISEIIVDPNPNELPTDVTLIDATGKYILPGVIDDQVHFREPGLTQKADIHSE